MAFATAVFKSQMISRVRGTVFIAVANKDAVAGSDQVQQVDDFCFIDGIGKYCTGESQQQAKKHPGNQRMDKLTRRGLWSELLTGKTSA